MARPRALVLTKCWSPVSVLSVRAHFTNPPVGRGWWVRFVKGAFVTCSVTTRPGWSGTRAQECRTQACGGGQLWRLAARCTVAGEWPAAGAPPCMDGPAAPACHPSGRWRGPGSTRQKLAWTARTPGTTSRDPLGTPGLAGCSGSPANATRPSSWLPRSHRLYPAQCR